MARNKLSINRVKVKATTSIANLGKEMEREDGKEWDRNGRNIFPERTDENVVLQPLPKYIDQYRKGLIRDLNQERANRSDGTQATRALSRALRSDTVDCITSVVQPSAEFISELSRTEQTRFFSDCLDVMRENPQTFGRVLGAVIHYDETTPHMQVVSSTLDFESLKSRGNEMMGNKTKMSSDQTAFVEAVKAKGWEIERGIQRVNNPEYQNWKDEKEAQGINVNRYTDEQLMNADKKAAEILETTQKQVQQRLSEAERQSDEIAEKLWRTEWQEAKKTGHVRDGMVLKFPDNPSKITLNDETARLYHWGMNKVSYALNQVWNYISRKINETKAQVDKILSSTKQRMQNIASKFAIDVQNDDSLENIAEKVSSDLERKSEALTSKEKEIDEKVEYLDSQSAKFVELDSKIAGYKKELLEQIEPLVFARFPDNTETRDVLKYWKDKATLEEVLADFNKVFLETDVDEEKLGKVNKDIADSHEALKLWEEAQKVNYPKGILEQIENLGFRHSYGFRPDVNFSEWREAANKKAYDVFVPNASVGEWTDTKEQQDELFYYFTEEKNIEPHDLPWPPHEIKDFLKKQESKKLILKSDKSQFVSQLNQTVREYLKKQEALRAKDVGRDISRGRSI